MTMRTKGQHSATAEARRRKPRLLSWLSFVVMVGLVGIVGLAFPGTVFAGEADRTPMITVHVDTSEAQSGTVAGTRAAVRERSELGTNHGSEVPFELSNGFLIMVEGRIGGLTNLKFILDTGVTKTVVNRKLAKMLHLRLQRDSHRVFNFGQTADLEWAMFPAIEFGSVKVANVPLLVGELSRYSEFAQGVDALIGLDLLHLSNLVIDYDSRKVLFSSAVDAAPSATMAAVSPCLIVSFQVQKQPLHLIVDTGLRDILLFEDRLRKRVTPLTLKDLAEGISMGEHLRGRRATLPGARLGASETDLRVMLVKGPQDNVLSGIDGYLGIAMLQARRVTFDFAAPALGWQ